MKEQASWLLVATTVYDDEHSITAMINFVLSMLFSPQAVDDERSVFKRITARQTTIVDNDDDDEQSCEGGEHGDLI